jgi:hypothetical protein
MGDGVADRRAVNVLDAGDDEADLAGAQQSVSVRLGVKTPSWSTSWARPMDLTRSCRPF